MLMLQTLLEAANDGNMALYQQVSALAAALLGGLGIKRIGAPRKESPHYHKRVRR